MSKIPCLLLALSLAVPVPRAIAEDIDVEAREALQEQLSEMEDKINAMLENFTDAEIEELTEQAVAKQEEVEALAPTMEALSLGIGEYKGEVARRSAESADIERKIAALLLLARTPEVTPDTLPPDAQARLRAEIHAGAMLRPEILALVHLACSDAPGRRARAAESSIAACADAPDTSRLTAIAPSNAYFWLLASAHARAAGDPSAARSMLVASGRSTQYESPVRTGMRIVSEALAQMPPPESLRAMSDALGKELGGIYGGAFTVPAPSMDDLLALSVWSIGSALGRDLLQPASSICAQAAAGEDRELLVACRRLARMVADGATTLHEYRGALRLLADIEAPAASALAAERLAAFDEEMRALPFGTAMVMPGLGALTDDVAILIAEGEIAMLRRQVERLAGMGLIQAPPVVD